MSMVLRGELPAGAPLMARTAAEPYDAAHGSPRRWPILAPDGSRAAVLDFEAREAAVEVGFSGERVCLLLGHRAFWLDGEVASALAGGLLEAGAALSEYVASRRVAEHGPTGGRHEAR